LQGLTDALARTVLRSQLMMLAASDVDPVETLRRAIRDGGLDDARDSATVLSRRLNWVERNGPLPWLSTVPERLAKHPQWGSHLASRSELVQDLAAEVREASAATEARWQDALSADLVPELVAQISVWRAAMGVSADDLSPTGPAQVPGAASRWQRVLDDHVGLSSPTLRHWTAVARQLAPQLRDDPRTPVLAAKLASCRARARTCPSFSTGRCDADRCRTTTPRPPCYTASSVVHVTSRSTTSGRPSSSPKAWASGTSACVHLESIGPTATESASDPTSTRRNTMTAQPRPADRPSEYLTIAEAAARYHVSRDYIRHRIIDGSLPAVRSASGSSGSTHCI
jgi:excisionase family DNA binding protein